jgi:hypothetical protein
MASRSLSRAASTSYWRPTTRRRLQGAADRRQSETPSSPTDWKSGSPPSSRPSPSYGNRNERSSRGNTSISYSWQPCSSKPRRQSLAPSRAPPQLTPASSPIYPSSPLPTVMLISRPPTNRCPAWPAQRLTAGLPAHRARPTVALSTTWRPCRRPPSTWQPRARPGPSWTSTA